MWEHHTSSDPVCYFRTSTGSFEIETCLKKELSVLTLTIPSPREKLIFALCSDAWRQMPFECIKSGQPAVFLIYRQYSHISKTGHL
jgi:hypothetical protein